MTTAKIELPLRNFAQDPPDGSRGFLFVRFPDSVSLPFVISCSNLGTAVVEEVLLSHRASGGDDCNLFWMYLDEIRNPNDP